MISALQASAIDVRDLENVPLPVARQQTARGSAGGIMIRTTPGVPDSVDIMFFDERGADLSQAGASASWTGCTRGRSTGVRSPARSVTCTSRPASSTRTPGSLLRNVDTTGIAESGLKVVVDASNGSAGLVLPSLLGRLGVDALTINPGLDESRPTETADARRSGLVRLGEIVASARAAFGVRFDPVGERLSLVDERGRIIEDDRALLVMLDLVAAERRSGRVALPVTTTRIAEQVAAYHGTQVEWTTTSPDDLTRVGREETTIFGGDGRGRVHRPGVQQRLRRLGGLRPAHRPGGADAAHAEPDRRADSAGARPQAGPARRRGRSRDWSCGASSRRPATGTWTPPTACGWWRPTGAG